MSVLKKEAVNILHRFSIRQGLADKYLEVWSKLVKLRQRYGFKVMFATLDSGVPCKFTWCYSYDGDIDDAEARLKDDPEYQALWEEGSKYTWGNHDYSQVSMEYDVVAAHEKNTAGKTTIMRRYYIRKNSWESFMETWHNIVPMRANYGFHCIFAVADKEKDIFTWAFAYDGKPEDFDALQKPYYADPGRESQTVVNNYILDFAIVPTQQLIIP